MYYLLHLRRAGAAAGLRLRLAKQGHPQFNGVERGEKAALLLSTPRNSFPCKV
jgi:hypothetical protein